MRRAALVAILVVLLIAATSVPGINSRHQAEASHSSLGYWLLGRDGGIFTHGGAQFFGSLPGRLAEIGAPQVNDVTGMAEYTNGHGYWIVQSNGGVHAFGEAPFLGSMQSLGLVPAAPIVAILGTLTGQGYWLFGADGGVITFGDARYFGGMAGIPLEAPVVAAARANSGDGGYFFIERLGGVHARGNAVYKGNIRPGEVTSPIVAMQGHWDYLDGYWGVEANGGVHARGSAPFLGSAFGVNTAPVSGIASPRNIPPARGYWLVSEDGNVYAFNVPDLGNSRGPLAAPIVDIESATFPD